MSNFINYVIDKFKRDNEQAKTEIVQQGGKLQQVFNRIRQVRGVVNIVLGWEEIIITTDSYETACSIEDTLYDGSLTIQKAPVPFTDHWEVRIEIIGDQNVW